MTSEPTPKPVTAILDAQNAANGGVLQPGQPGYWQIHGASVRDIATSDLLMAKLSNGEIVEIEVASVDHSHVLPVGVVDQAGESFWFGLGAALVLLRQGTHNTLSPFCR